MRVSKSQGGFYPGAWKKSREEFLSCQEVHWDEAWLLTDIFILIAGAAANGALLWLFHREGRPMSASKVLGVNLVAMDLIFLSFVPFVLVYDSQMAEQLKQNNSATFWQYFNTMISVDYTSDIFSMFNLIGSPLLLTCMCMERYVAVVRPVLYLSLRKWEYRMAVSAVVWAITLSFCVATGVVLDFTVIIIPISITISCLFLLMLGSLGGVIHSLRQQSPAHEAGGKRARSDSPLKRQAVKNVLIVVVPAVISYMPILVVAPLGVYAHSLDSNFSSVMCTVLELSLFFPRFGVFIGPLFYLSKARQICSRKKRKLMNE